MVSLASAVLPILRILPPETAHALTLRGLAQGLVPAARGAPDPVLRSTLWGREFPNPIGLAAGFDKDALVPDAMLRLGFGFVEIGSVTPRPQRGNPKPRIFRLSGDGAVINRLGFNNAGLAVAAERLAARRGRGGIVGANIGKNRDTGDPYADYEECVRVMAPLADYLVVNISSPNTPGVRDLQRRQHVAILIDKLMAVRRATVAVAPPPLFVKIAPDLTEEERADLAEVAVSSGIDGLIISNTTIARPPGLRGSRVHEPGGLSGKPLFLPSTALLAEMYRRTGGRVRLIGVGGITKGADAYAKIRAGASLVQLYTGLVYQGPALIQRITDDLAVLLRRDGFDSVAAAVGSGG
ncbi:MAG: pyrD [Rhodospirillales bacterium]|jgi:dihydroorotate dehydrogenase|nr:pyrD [Rhodospirillales bacterium]